MAPIDEFAKKMLARTLAIQAKTVGNRLKASPVKGTDQNTAKKTHINCHKCEYFYITWQNSTPYGCKAHGFCSAQIPSMVVASSSGKPCLLFTPKQQNSKR